MKIIDEYLKTLYKNDKSKEIKELKEELREHLITSTNEFISQGYSEEDSQREAIKQFDGGTEMLKELHKTLKETKSIYNKLNKKMINIFRNISIISLIVVLSTMLYAERLNSNILYISNMLTATIKNIVYEKDIYNSKTYENELEQLLKTKEFKDVRNLNISLNAKPNNMGQSVYSYTDKINQTNSLTRLGWSTVGETSKGDRAGFDVDIDYRPMIRANIVHGSAICVGLISIVVYIASLVMFRLKVKRGM